MVTGAGGSIGSELCRQMLDLRPTRLILYEHAEFNLYQVLQSLENQRSLMASSPTQLIPVLGSVKNPDRMMDVLRTYPVDTVYHAAAYKHVPMVEHNIQEGLHNNVLGTLYTAQAAIATGVKNFVLISTDKVVRPTNVMGASKRLAELALQALSQETAVHFYHPEKFFPQLRVSPVKNLTRFSMVRFGNVLGSSGSVIPLFRQQIREGGPVTVTHPNITRFFMTTREAAQLVIQAGALGAGGELYVLDMGEPVKIYDVARKMIHLAGFQVKDKPHGKGDIEIHFTGLRPGEKLYEELLISGQTRETQHPMIIRVMDEGIHWNRFTELLDQLHSATKAYDYAEIKSLLGKVVSGFRSEREIVDWLSPGLRESAYSEAVLCTEVHPGKPAGDLSGEAGLAAVLEIKQRRN
jgi:FlaA1/EpsC-like NDP-sugar epimerase